MTGIKIQPNASRSRLNILLMYVFPVLIGLCDRARCLFLCPSASVESPRWICDEDRLELSE